VEAKLNETYGKDKQKFEILNFTYNGYSAVHYQAVMEMDVPKFKPDIALFTVRTRDFNFAYKKFFKSYRGRDKNIGPELTKFLKDNEIEFYNPMSYEMSKEFGKKLWLWSYKKIQSICEQNGIKPVLLYIPELNVIADNYLQDYIELLELNKTELGFDVIDLDGVYGDENRDELNVNNNANGNHPNERGHSLIADRLYLEMVEYFNLNE
jgi:hypothetical protein